MFYLIFALLENVESSEIVKILNRLIMIHVDCGQLNNNIRGRYVMVKNDFNRLRCPKCNRYYLNKDLGFLDDLNTVIHQCCFTSFFFPIKDRGTYRKLIQKYSLFDDLV